MGFKYEIRGSFFWRCLYKDPRKYMKFKCVRESTQKKYIISVLYLKLELKKTDLEIQSSYYVAYVCFWGSDVLYSKIFFISGAVTNNVIGIFVNQLFELGSDLY